MLGLGIARDNFHCKAEALKYSLESTRNFKDNTIIYDFDRAQKLYDFICTNVNLPDVEPEPLKEFTPLINVLIDKIKGVSTDTTCD